MSGLREVPGKSRVLTHTTECHSPALTGSPCSQIFSWLPPAKKTKQKGDAKTEQNKATGLVEREEAGVSVQGGKVGEER